MEWKWDVKKLCIGFPFSPLSYFFSFSISSFFKTDAEFMKKSNFNERCEFNGFSLSFPF